MTNPNPQPNNGPDLFDEIRFAISNRFQRLRGGGNTRFSWMKAVAFFITIAMWAYGFYYGWVMLPDISALGGAFGIFLLAAFVVGVVLSVFTDSIFLRLLGVIGAFGAGIALALKGADLRGLFANFTVANTLGLLLAVLWTVGVALWICRSPRR